MSRFGQRTRVSTAISAWMPTGDEVPQNPTSIEMLLAGGGGAGGVPNGIGGPPSPAGAGSGGGAGGLYSSVTSNPGGGPGGVVASATAIAAGVTYTITIGGSATPSTFAAPTIPTITSNAGSPGGPSGGTAGGAAGAYTGNPSTYAGGPGSDYPPEASQGGGGGGAAGTGFASSDVPNVARGGNAITNTIRAASPTFPQSYSGGGGGGEAVARRGSQGPGGGTYGTGATANPSSFASANPGQPGVCVFRYPDTFPTAPTTTGSPELITTGGYHIYTFTSSGTVSW